MRIKLLGKHYDLRFVARLGPKSQPFAGDCSHPDAPAKRIRIVRGQEPREELDTVIHECLHAVDWHRDEEWVHQVATDIAAVLWKLGYRKTE